MFLSKHWYITYKQKLTLSSIASALDWLHHKSSKVDIKVQINAFINAYVHILYMIDRKSYKNKRTIYMHVNIYNIPAPNLFYHLIKKMCLICWCFPVAIHLKKNVVWWLYLFTM